MIRESLPTTAQIEITSPFDDPTSYDPYWIAERIRTLDWGGGPDQGPGFDQELFADAVRAGDVATAQDFLRPIRDWLMGDPPFQVLDAGNAEIDVPFLMTSAPLIDQIEVVATVTRAAGYGGGLAFKVAGNGLSADAKISITSGYTLNCAPGESLVAVVKLPIFWQERADKINADRGKWLHAVPVQPKGPASIAVRLVPNLPDALVVGGLAIDNTAGGKNAPEVTKEFAVEANLGFSVGFKIDALGIDTTLSAKAENAMTVELGAKLPRGYSYDIRWLGAPPGVTLVNL